jgi:hypothetical protein
MMRNLYKPEGKIPFERPVHRWENIHMDCKKTPKYQYHGSIICSGVV